MNQLLRYRNVWLGVAMVWIVWYHSGLHIPAAWFVYPKRWGYGGVDICLFASGIGCYFSLGKDSDILRFMKRRVLRLAPTYLCFMVIWIAYKRITISLPWQAAIGNLMGIQSLTGMGNDFNWYISALILCYVGAPYMKRLVDRLEKIWMQSLLISILLLASVPFWGSNTYLIIVTRIPIFYIGMLFAKQCSRDYVLRKKGVFLAVLIMMAGFFGLYIGYKAFPEYVTLYGLCWYPFVFITPGLCIAISLTVMAVEKNRLGYRIIKLMEWIGKNSFEVYLIHIPIYEILKQICDTWDFSFPANLLWLGSVPVIGVGCFLLKSAVKLVSEIWNKRMTKKAS